MRVARDPEPALTSQAPEPAVEQSWLMEKESHLLSVRAGQRPAQPAWEATNALGGLNGRSPGWRGRFWVTGERMRTAGDPGWGICFLGGIS